MAVVYQHSKKDNGEVFYVGISNNGNRPYSKHNRSDFWNSVVEKHGLLVDIIYKNLSWEEACELECFLIKIYGRRDLGRGNLVNLTDGGEGSLGCIQSEETINKKVKSREGYRHSKETKVKMGLSQKGRVITDFHRAKISKAHKNKTIPESTKLKMSKAKSKKVIQIETGRVFTSAKEASESIGLSPASVSRVCTGKEKTSGGYTWKYLK